MSAIETLIWNRGSTKLVWAGAEIVAPGALLRAAELPKKNGFSVVTLFDENTPHDVPNAFIYDKNKVFQPLKIKEEGMLVRFLGCYSEGNKIIFKATNETEYLINPETREIQSTRYYR